MFEEFMEELEELELCKDRSRAIRRKANAKAKRHLRKIEPFTMSVRPTRNGGIIHKGDTYSWLPYWKRMNSRLARYNGKREIADFFSDDSEPFDAYEDWNGMYFDKNFPTKEDGTIDINKVVARKFFYCDDDDNHYNYKEYDQEDYFELIREITIYEDFLGEFNLNRLFMHWKEAKGV